MPTHSTILKNKHGDEFALDLHHHGEPRPTIVICHGFKGFKDWGFFPATAAYLHNDGFTTIRFNFSHNGVGTEDLMDFTRLDLFKKNTFSLEQDDLDAVLTWAVEQGSVDANRIGLLGHSRGGGTALIRAFCEKDPRVKAVTTWNSISDMAYFPPSVMDAWREHGHVPIFNARTGQEMTVGREGIEDIDAKVDVYNFADRLKERDLPLLIVQGETDTSVAPINAQKLYDASNHPHTEHVTVPDAGHTFEAVHPFAGMTPQLEFALKETSHFFQDQLSS